MAQRNDAAGSGDKEIAEAYSEFLTSEDPLQPGPRGAASAAVRGALAGGAPLPHPPTSRRSCDTDIGSFAAPTRPAVAPAPLQRAHSHGAEAAGSSGGGGGGAGGPALRSSRRGGAGPGMAASAAQAPAGLAAGSPPARTGSMSGDDDDDGASSGSSGGGDATGEAPAAHGASGTGAAAAAARPLFRASLLRQHQDAIAAAPLEDLWSMAADFLDSADGSGGKSGGKSGGSRGGTTRSAARERRGAPAAARPRASERRKLQALEAELAAKMDHLRLLEQQHTWLRTREAVLNDLMRVNQHAAAAPAAPDAPAAATGEEGPAGVAAGNAPGAHAAAGAAAALTDASVGIEVESAAPGADSVAAACAALACAAKTGGGVAGALAAAAAGSAGPGGSLPGSLPSSSSGGSGSEGAGGGLGDAKDVRAAVAAIQANPGLQATVKAWSVEQYLEATRGYVREYALFLRFCEDDPGTMARLEASVARHRLQEATILLVAVDLMFAAQYRHLESGVLAPPGSVPTSHWNRALERMRPPLSPSTERAQFHAMLLYQRAMKTLDEERRTILSNHRDATDPTAAATDALQSDLRALLRRFEAVNLVHNLYAIYALSPMQWASLFVASYPFVPSVYVELWGEALRRYLLRIAEDGG